ncbi:sensor histidine kinase [Aquimarina algicola]|nr:sensor histidine kinase [Aquimarina algicola]
MKKMILAMKHPFFNHLLFWIGVFLYFAVTSNMTFFDGYVHMIESSMTLVIMQMVATYVILYVFIPRFLDQKKNVVFTVFVLLLLSALFVCYMAIRAYYFDIKYLYVYSDIAKEYALMSFGDRLLDLSTFVSKIVKFLTPLALLLLFRFYRKQKDYLKLNEQKKIAELTALKNQLNPHFLFNTLNNLYSLAIKKSDKTPEVIEKLSDILDYMLYRCNHKYVPIQKEIELIENYLALEKIRYGKRVAISFINKIEKEVRIAPLILLTFIENAFKHGVSQELNIADINIKLTLVQEEILFTIFNTKPNHQTKIVDSKNELGLKNVKQQLELLYPNAYTLLIENDENSFAVSLKLKQQ